MPHDIYARLILQCQERGFVGVLLFSWCACFFCMQHGILCPFDAVRQSFFEVLQLV